MSLTDEIALVQTRQRKCGLGDAIRNMDPDEAAQWLEAFKNPTLQTVAITTVMKKRGYQVNRFQIAECGRKGACECGAICG